MLLALWPLFIAMPETANYALRDQQKRDERRIAAKRKQIDDELAARRLNVSTETSDIHGLSFTSDENGNDLRDSSNGINDIRGNDFNESGLIEHTRIAMGINGEMPVTRESGIDLAMKRRNDEALFLILASL